MPTVSVIIPTYNRATLLPRAVSSVLNQTFQDLELLVVDDCSKDDTARLVAGFADRRIRYLRQDVNLGCSAARNRAIALSKCAYIAFLDDDDEWLPQKLEIQVERMERGSPKLGVVSAAYLRVNAADGKIISLRVPSARGYAFNELSRANCLGPPSVVVIKRACFEQVGGFDENLRGFNDYDMWIRIARQFHVDCVEQPLVKYYVHRVRISTNPEIMSAGVDKMLAKHPTLPIGKYLSHSATLAGMAYCELGNRRESRKAFLKAIRLAPRTLKHYLIFALALLGPGCLRTARGLKQRLWGLR
jgi:glycosyltransferase involved in cell wall biosynthesis